MERKNKFLQFMDDNPFVVHFLFMILVFIGSYFYTHLRFSLNREYHRATISLLLNNSAELPYQYRILIPWLAGVMNRIHISFLDSPIRIFQLVEFASVFFLIVAFRKYLSLVIVKEEIPKTKSDISYTPALLSFTLFYALPFNFLFPRYYPVWYPWDMPSVLFFTMGLILLYQKKWIYYYPLFIAATFNRETTCFLTFVYLFTAIGRSPFKRVGLHCAFQLLIWLSIKYFLYQLYSENPGHGVFATRMAHNIEFLKNPRSYSYLFSSMGFIWIPVLFYFRFIPDFFVKRSLLVLIPFMGGLFVVGNMDELRIYGEMIPVMLIAFLLLGREVFIRWKNRGR
jgi:hypothetical protein